MFAVGHERGIMPIDEFMSVLTFHFRSYIHRKPFKRKALLYMTIIITREF